MEHGQRIRVPAPPPPERFPRQGPDPVFQSLAWERFQRGLGHQLISGAGDGWRCIARLQSDRFGTVAYAPDGPVARDAAALADAVADLRTTARSAGAYRAIIEPPLPIHSGEVQALADRRIRGYRHARTRVIDLARPWDEVFAEMSRTRRKQFRRAEAQGVHFGESHDPTDIERFLRLYRQTAEIKKFPPREGSYFYALQRTLIATGDARLFVAHTNGSLRVVAIVIDHGVTRSYLYVGRDRGEASVPVSAAFMVWLIRDAQLRGLEVFDLFGIADDDDIADETTGYTRFKRSFGGEAVTFAGTWELPLRPLRYRLRRLAQRVRGGSGGLG